MSASFSTPDKFDRQKAFTRVVFGYDAPLMETELNEMQKIFADKFNTLARSISSNGFVNLPPMTLSAGVFTLPVDAFILDGIIFQMIEPMTISVSNGDTIYLAVWEQVVTYQDTLKVGGNLSGGSTIADNGIFDSRVGEETTRRVQLQMQLVKTNTDPNKSYLPVATITGASTFTDNRVKAQLNLGLPNNFVDTANLKDASVSDSKLGDRTVTDSTAPTTNTGSLTYLLSGIAYMIKAITGKSSWRTAPATTLEAAKSHMDATTGVHGATSTATPNTLVQRDGNGRFKAAAPSASDDVARKDTVDNAIAALRGAAPSTLDTLAKLAQAIENNPNFAATINEALAEKLDKTGGTMTGDINSSAADFQIGKTNNTGRTIIKGGNSGSVATGANIHVEGINYGGTGAGGNVRVNLPAGKNLLVNGNKTWHAGNDGAGSGLDADLLDGKHAGDLVNSIAVYDTGEIDPNTTTDAYILTRHSNAPIDGSFWHIHTFFYSGKTGNRAQMAQGYLTDELYIRYYYNGTWSSWKRIWHAGNDGAGSGLDADMLDGRQPSTSASANTIVQRDSGGRIKAAAPSASDDVARKAEVDAVQNSLSGHIGSGGSAHAVATTSQAGFMSAADKSKLNGIEAGAQVNTVTSVAGKTGAVTLSKSDVGLGNVQNYGIASQSQAQAGTDNASYMTPLRTKQAINQFVPIETGTWTPELRFGGWNTGITYSFRAGRYTRIANVVYWSFDIQLSSKGSASGNATIDGLPFDKPFQLDFYHAVGRASNISVPSGRWLSYLIVSSTIYLVTNTSSSITSAEFSNNSVLSASGFYFI